MVRIGVDRVISQSDTMVAFAMQIGVTRIGSGGRCMPRSKRGAMCNVVNLVASEFEVQELISMPVQAKKITKPAVLARFIVALAAMVVCYKALVTWICLAKRFACEVIARVYSKFNLNTCQIGHCSLATYRGR